jgi:opacity protein-like surface antigen
VGKKFAVGFVLFLFPVLLHAQAVSPVTPKLATISAGGYFSYGQMDYGQHHNMGIGGFGDFDYRIWREFGIGIEGEARFMNFNEKSGVYDQNFLGGPRVTYRFGSHLLPYVKVLAGGTRFHYPPFISNQVYNYTTLAIGGGIDYKLNDRWSIRPADFEYQRLVDYPPTALTPWVYSAGVSYRIF